MQYYCNVIVIESDVISDNYLIVGTVEQEVRSLAETKFLDLCREVVPSFDEFTQEDIAPLLKEGFVKYWGGSVSISWPE